MPERLHGREHDHVWAALVVSDLDAIVIMLDALIVTCRQRRCLESEIRGGDQETDDQGRMPCQVR